MGTQGFRTSKPSQDFSLLQSLEMFTSPEAL